MTGPQLTRAQALCVLLFPEATSNEKEETAAYISQFVDKAYEQMDFAKLADSPVAAIQGLNEGDTEKLKDAFGVDTARELAERKFIRTALAITALAR